MENSDDDEVFPGFWHPEEKRGFTQLPHELIERLPRLDLTELKIILYIFRHTWGFQEFGTLKRLTTDEFMKGRKRSDGTRYDQGTGLSDWGVKDGIAKALKHGYIVCDVNDKDRARIKKKYGIHTYIKEPDD
jgi:hypothetical protein